MTQCQNCQTLFEGIFCPHCGQKDVDLSRPTSQLIGELLKETVEVDGRVLRTIRTLFLKPGALTREFLDGRRRFYTSPVRLYLVISLLFFVLVSWIAGQGVLLMSDAHPLEDAASQARFVADELPRLMFVLMPVFALLLKLFFRVRNYFDHIIFSIHLHSASYIVLALMLPLERIAEEHWLPLIAQLILFAYILSYFVISLRRVYHTSRKIAITKSAFILVAYIGIVTAVLDATAKFQAQNGWS